MAQVITTGGGKQVFANGAIVERTDTATSDGATPPNLSNFQTAYVITPGPGGAMPPGYTTDATTAFPGATIAE